MVEPKNFTSPDFRSDSENYDLLLEKGISLIQNFSGEKWTDFNYHDPGVTILEQLCYAITDLGYRNNFSIQDLLIGKKDGYNLEKTNLFFPIDRILPSAPLIPSDFQRIIIEQVEAVKNAWVHPVEDNILGFQGLYNVFVQFEEGYESEESEIQIKNSIVALLAENRSLGTDFQDIKILKKDNISIHAKIDVDSFVLGETILSEIYFQIENVLNPHVRFHDLETMRENGKSIRDLFSGPAPVKGFINSEDFALKTNEIYISEIKEIIEKIDGVLEVKEIFLFKNGVKVFEDLITFGEDNYPFLEKNIRNYNAASEQIQLFRDQIKYEVDTVILSQLYDSLSISEKNNYYKTVSSQKVNINGRFTKAQIQEYYSIQNEFPAVYGLKVKEIPAKSSSKRKAQVKQLRGFLLLFEQLMANHLSQLANFHQFFSIEKNISKTFYSQYPHEIPKIDELIPFKSELEYTDFLESISESRDHFYERRTQIVDHLLSRFSEFIDVSTLSKLMKIESEDISDLAVKQAMLDTKIEYAQHLIENGKNRCLGFNYKKEFWETENISGLEKRLKLLLKIPNTNTHSLINPILDSYEKVEAENDWSIAELKVNSGPSIQVLVSNASEEEGLHYYTATNKAFKALFNYANKSKSYTILEVQSKEEKRHHLLYNEPGMNQPIEVFVTDTEEQCKIALEKGINKFEKLNKACEGFFLVEHILLRPLLTTNYSTSFFDDKSEACLVSYDSGSFEEQNDLRDDIFVLGSNKENYSIIKSETKKVFKIVLFDIFNKPVYQSPKILYSNIGAKSEIKRLTDFFVQKREEELLVEQFSEISIDKGNSHEFPSDFQYSNQVSLILPDWPQRFQNSEFKAYFKKSLEEHLPAQFKYNIFYLDVNKISLFEDTFFNWLETKKADNYDQADIYSLQLIQLLKGFKQG
jgi:hypothetical protein